MDEDPGRRRGRFAGHPLWWWTTAALTAVAVVGAVVLLSLPV
ncbi:MULTISPECIES: hypothetical protein [unclassified Microbacterium]|nr:MULTISPECIES: hypothetical protein [unclassified Microbacterium]MCR2810457.1 hypothetical protein [Microbacterium sp. zg.B185]WIM18509.1 hypothetical protein QNO12_13035 [Microbacterium sp. zg-B185]